MTKSNFISHIADLASLFGKTLSKPTVEAYWSQMSSMRDDLILRGFDVAKRDCESMPPVKTLKDLCMSPVAKVAMSTPLDALKAHPLYATVPKPRPYGYPSDETLAARGPECIKIYNAIAKGQVKTALALSIGQLEDSGELDKLPEFTRSELNSAKERMANMGLKVPKHIDLDLCCRSFLAGAQS